MGRRVSIRRSGPAARVVGRPGPRLLLGAGLVSLTGDWVLRVGLGYAVFVLTGSTVVTAGVLLASFLPQVLLGSVAGVFVDRWDRRRTLVAANVALAAGLLPLLAVRSAGTVWVVYLVLAVQGCLAQVVLPAQQALLPALVGVDDLVAANALSTQSADVARLVGSGLGGVVAAAGGVAALAVVDLASFLLAAALLARMPGSGTAPVPGGPAPAGAEEVAGRLRRLGREWTDGLRYVTRGRTLRVVATFVLVTSVGEGVMGTLFAPFVRAVLHGGGRSYGLVVAVQAAGGIAGGLVAATVAARVRPALLLGFGSVAFGALDLVMFLYPLAWVSIWPAAGCMVLAGLPGALMLAGAMTLLQREVPDGYRGRVFGGLGTVEGAAMVAGTVAAGLLPQAVGIIPVLVAQGAGYLLAGSVVLLALGRTRTGDRAGPAGATVALPLGR